MPVQSDSEQTSTLPAFALSTAWLSDTSSSSGERLSFHPRRHLRSRGWKHLIVLPEEDVAVPRQRREDPLIRLLRGWLADESGYDEETWPVVKQVIEENRLSYRKRFRD